ncbi:MAG: glycerophosphodiester phosphodiesterase family protein [Gammaproteobacteria bacterium]|nr:glycerophosphodiester phosphodiesterase family protein [Gammaproteobacteria bacterium]
MAYAIHLVGHRGQPDSFPENSLESFTHAIRSGAAYIETDVQVTVDGVVVLSHDADIKKLTGVDIDVTKNTYASFKNIPAGFPGKFSDKFNHCRIATLMEFSDLLQYWPGVVCFIEIKQESLLYFGNKVVDLVVEALQKIEDQSVLISFDYDALVYARNKYHSPVGWVLPEWSSENKIKAETLSPEYLFVGADFCPDNKIDIWSGAWKWVVYTINTAEDIKKYSNLGINIIETNCFSELQGKAL